MEEETATCKKCGAEFLKRTADQNNGKCMKCGGATSLRNTLEDFFDGLSCLIRLTIAILSGVVFALITVGIFSDSPLIIKVVISTIAFAIGFIVGLLLPYIRLLLSLLIFWD